MFPCRAAFLILTACNSDDRILQQIVHKRRQKPVKMDDSTLDTVHKAEGDPVHSMVMLCGVGESNQGRITYISAASTNGATPSAVTSRLWSSLQPRMQDHTLIHATVRSWKLFSVYILHPALVI